MPWHLFWHQGSSVWSCYCQPGTAPVNFDCGWRARSFPLQDVHFHCSPGIRALIHIGHMCCHWSATRWRKHAVLLETPTQQRLHTHTHTHKQGTNQTLKLSFARILEQVRGNGKNMKVQCWKGDHWALSATLSLFLALQLNSVPKLWMNKTQWQWAQEYHACCCFSSSAFSLPGVIDFLHLDKHEINCQIDTRGFLSQWAKVFALNRALLCFGDPSDFRPREAASRGGLQESCARRHRCLWGTPAGPPRLDPPATHNCLWAITGRGARDCVASTLSQYLLVSWHESLLLAAAKCNLKTPVQILDSIEESKTNDKVPHKWSFRCMLRNTWIETYLWATALQNLLQTRCFSIAIFNLAVGGMLPVTFTNISKTILVFFGSLFRSGADRVGFWLSLHAKQSKHADFKNKNLCSCAQPDIQNKLISCVNLPSEFCGKEPCVVELCVRRKCWQIWSNVLVFSQMIIFEDRAAWSVVSHELRRDYFGNFTFECLPTTELPCKACSCDLQFLLRLSVSLCHIRVCHSCVRISTLPRGVTWIKSNKKHFRNCSS